MTQVSFDTRFDVAKVDTEQRVVFGWANVSVRKNGTLVIDSQNDVIELSDLESAAYDFVLTSGKTGDMHQGPALGHVVESMVFTPEKLTKMGIAEDAVPHGWWVGFHIDDQVQWDLVKKGERRMFSIQGTAHREEM